MVKRRYPRPVERDLLMNEKRRDIEVDIAAFADERTPPPLPGPLQGELSRGRRAGAIDTRLAALALGEVHDPVERVRVARKRFIHETELLCQVQPALAGIDTDYLPCAKGAAEHGGGEAHRAHPGNQEAVPAIDADTGQGL